VTRRRNRGSATRSANLPLRPRAATRLPSSGLIADRGEAQNPHPFRNPRAGNRRLLRPRLILYPPPPTRPLRLSSVCSDDGLAGLGPDTAADFFTLGFMSVVIDPPEPSPSPRVYKRGWSPRYWRGSLDEILGAARAAHDEIKRQHPRKEIYERVSLRYGDGSTQDLGSLDALQAAIPAIDIGDVTGLSISTGVFDDTAASIGIASMSYGLDIEARGSEAFAAGMVATVKSRLTGGAEAGERAARVSLRLIDWLCLALVPAAVVAALVFNASLDHPPWLGFLLLVLTAGPALLAFSVIESGREKREPAGFVLVHEGEQFADAGDARTGPIWTLKAWFEKHPAVALLSVLVIGALLGRAADLIKL
jgi:hypothetical protein